MIDTFTIGNSTAKVGVIVFDGRSKTLVPLTDNADLLRNAVKEFVGGGASVCVYHPRHYTTLSVVHLPVAH